MSNEMRGGLRFVLVVFIAFVVGEIAPLRAATTGWNQTGAGPYEYTNTANWVGGDVNGLWDSSLTLPAAQIVTFTGDTVLQTPLSFNYLGNYGLTLRASATGTNTLTLVGDISVATGSGSSATVTLGHSSSVLNIDLGGVTRTFSILNNRTLTIQNSLTNGSLVVSGTGGKVTLAGINYHDYTIVTNGGLLSINGTRALGTGPLTIYGGTIDAGGVNTSNVNNNAMFWNGSFGFNGSKTLNLGNGPITLAGPMTLNVWKDTLIVGGVISGGNGIFDVTRDGNAGCTFLYTPPTTMTANQTLAVNIGTQTLSGAISGPGYSLTKVGAGILNLSGANTFSGGTIINAGYVQFGAGALPANGQVTINSGGTLIATGAYANAGAWVASGKIDPNSSGMLYVVGNDSANIDLSAGNYSSLILVTPANATLSGTITPPANGYLLGGGGSTLNLSGVNTLIGSGGATVLGNVKLTDSNSYSGILGVSSGTLTLGSTNGALSMADIVVSNGATLFLDSSANGVTGTTRAKSVTLLGGAKLTGAGNSATNSVDSISGALTVGAGGIDYVILTNGAARNLQLSVGNFARSPGGGLLNVRGKALGRNSIASLSSDSVNVVFGAAPASPVFLGDGGASGPTTLSIIVGGCGDTNVSGTVLGPTCGLLTYDSAYGLRVLDPSTEYISSITDGQTQLDNVRLANSAGAGILTNSVTTDTTINSLSFIVSGANATAGSGITLAGAGTLKLNSGVIYASQSVTGQPVGGNVNNAMTVNLPRLDLNGREGVFMAATIGLSSINSGGILDIQGAITNSGGNGVTIGGTGVIKFSGTNANVHTGTTTVNSGKLLLVKTSGINSIPGDLVVAGGTVEDVNNQIDDSANITISSGTFKLQIGNEGDSRSETFSNLTMRGGAYGTGASGHSGTTTIKGTATLEDGAMSIVQYAKVNVAGVTTMSGGTVSISGSFSAAPTYNTYMALNGGLIVSNTASGTYIPVTISTGNASVAGGELIVAGDVTVVGNSVNTNPVIIGQSTLPAGGIVALSGTRVFNIGNGAAASDFVVTSAITNYGASVGGITKTGSGVLELPNVNGYSGSTVVSNGTLILSGSLVSPVTVCSDAVLAGTGTVSTVGTALSVSSGGVIAPGSVGTTGTLTVAGDVYFASGAKLNIDASADADLLAVSGTVSGGGSPVSVVTTNVVGDGPWKIMTATSITASFTASSPDLVLNKNPAGTELWLYRGVRGSVLIIQ